MTAPGNRSRRVEYSISAPLNLENLRWLVEQCKELPGTASVAVKEGKSYSPIDWDEGSIKVSGEMPA